MDRSALQLLDDLIAAWQRWDVHENFYLTILAPGIVAGTERLPKREQPLVDRLRELLSSDEWERLPELLAARRSRTLTELTSDRERRNRQEEVAQREAEERRLREDESASRQRELEAARTTLLARLNDALESDFLSADARFAAEADSSLIDRDEYEELKSQFVRAWAASELGEKLDVEQAAAIASLTGDVQVIARAGSGKTRTLVTRALFLQKHCGVAPHELLLLAFNRRAADEMRHRLTRVLGDDLPHVMTFHALAHALVHPEQELVFDERDADQLGLSREVQEVIDEHIRFSEHRNRIRDLMLAYFREDWERIVDGRFQLTMDELLAYRRALPRESLGGDFVKSFGERIIANALFEYGVDYRYEPPFPWDGVNYRPDFMIRSPAGAAGGVVIEYFGLQGDSDYDEMSQQKRNFWSKQHDWVFLELSPRELARSGVNLFVRALLQRLEQAGVPVRRRSEEEIWQLVRRRAVDRFTEAMRTFVGRCRKRNLTPDDLAQLVAAHNAGSTAEALFVRIAISVYEGYLRRLAATDKEDFDGLMWRAVSHVRSGETRFARNRGRERGDVSGLRFVMIDEFQDFSQMFFELVEAVRSTNPGVQFFCVGDDWQAINGFAGSDLRFITDFTEHFYHASRRHIRSNYRSATAIVQAGNALMFGRGTEARPTRDEPGEVWLCRLDTLVLSEAERQQHDRDEITPATLRLVKDFLDRGLDVVLLSRRNSVPWYVGGHDGGSRPGSLDSFVDHLRSFLPEDDRDRISASTVHRYKGLERPAVIALDAIEGSFPLIHPTWMFLRVFGDSLERLEDEERRLFYVAMTRAGGLASAGNRAVAAKPIPARPTRPYG